MDDLSNLEDIKLRETYNTLDKSGEVLTLNFIWDRLTEKGLVVDHYGPKSKYWTSIIYHPEVFTTLSSFGHAAIGLKKWIPYRRKPTKKITVEHTSLLPDKPTQFPLPASLKETKRHIYSHKLTKEELSESFILISDKLLSLYEFSGTGFLLTIYCYGGYTFNVWVNSEFRSIHSPEIKKFFKDNELKVEDIIYLEKREDDPTGIHLYTKWQRYNEVKEGIETQKIKKAEDKKRKIKKEKRKEEINGEYLLVLIQKNDLVYRFLKNNGPSFTHQIANAISKDLGVNRSSLDKLSFIDFSDRRITRLENGMVGIKEIIENKLEDKVSVSESKVLGSQNKIFLTAVIIGIIVLVAMFIALIYLLL